MNLKDAIEQAEFTLTINRLNRGPETESMIRLIKLAKKCLEIRNDAYKEETHYACDRYDMAVDEE
jgi:hypothetical protein